MVYYGIMKPKANYTYKNEKRALETRKKRLYDRIKNMLHFNTYFLTFTFKEDAIKKTTKETRKRLIKSFLNEQAKNYILNIDYGKKNRREHYHAIANPKSDIFLLTKYKHGFIKAKRINKSIYGENTALYLMKHTIKDTTENNAIIFSRMQPKNSGFKYEEETNNLLKKWQTPSKKNKFDFKKFIQDEIKEIYDFDIIAYFKNDA